MNDYDLSKIGEIFQHHVGIITDGVGVNLSNKIGALAADLKAHPADTEAHKKIYKFKET